MKNSLKVLCAAIGVPSELVDFIFDLPKKIKPIDDRFLIYNAGDLIAKYASETPVEPNLAYVLRCDLIELNKSLKIHTPDIIRFNTDTKTFVRSRGSNEWNAKSVAGFNALFQSGRIKDNEPLVRVCKVEIDSDSGILVLTVQKAYYHDQAYSNLILDFDAYDNDKTIVKRSLRQQLLDQKPGQLPDLDDKRLANTLGVAILIWYPDDKDISKWVPYLIRRVNKVGVFPGGVHCSASGAVKWGKSVTEITLKNVTDHLLFEVKEELGLKPCDLEDIRPVAFCQEMARGGKPQLFYCARTHKSRAELSHLRQRAGRVARSLGGWEEVQRNNWLQSGDVVMDTKTLEDNIALDGVTLECAAAVHFGLKYINGIGEQQI